MMKFWCNYSQIIYHQSEDIFLVTRYYFFLIQTYTGSILVAVNPYRMFNIYGLDVVKQYEDAMLGSQPP